MLLAIDPGLAHVGAALFASDGSLLDADVFTSKPEKRPSSVVGAWYAKDLGRRGTALSTWLCDLMDDREDINESVDAIVVEGFVLSGENSGGIASRAYGYGVVDAVVSEAVASAVYVTPNQWRAALGFTATKAPKGTSDAKRRAYKRDDDARLYGLLASLPDGDRVVEMVRGHGRRGSDVVHALDAFGIGRAWLQRAIGDVAGVEVSGP